MPHFEHVISLLITSVLVLTDVVIGALAIRSRLRIGRRDKDFRVGRRDTDFRVGRRDAD